MRKIFLLILLFFSYNNGVLAYNNNGVLAYITAKIDGYIYYVSTISLDAKNRASWCNSFGAKLLTADEITPSLIHKIYQHDVEEWAKGNEDNLLAFPFDDINNGKIVTADPLGTGYLQITFQATPDFSEDNKACFIIKGNNAIGDTELDEYCNYVCDRYGQNCASMSFRYDLPFCRCAHEAERPSYYEKIDGQESSSCEKNSGNTDVAKKECDWSKRKESLLKCEGLRLFEMAGGNGVTAEVCYPQRFKIVSEGKAFCRKFTSE